MRRSPSPATSAFRLYSNETTSNGPSTCCESAAGATHTNGRRERMANPQVIVDAAGRPAFAVIPWRDYQRLTSGHVPNDDLSDEALFDRAVAENEEAYPISVVDRIIAGESPIRVISRTPQNDAEGSSRSSGYRRTLSLTDRTEDTHRIGHNAHGNRQGATGRPRRPHRSMTLKTDLRSDENKASIETRSVKLEWTREESEWRLRVLGRAEKGQWTCLGR